MISHSQQIQSLTQQSELPATHKPKVVMPSPRTCNLLAVSAVAMLLAGCSVMPNPLTGAELQAISEKNLANVTANQEGIQGAISLHQAMARALKYNLDHKVEMMQTSLRETELKLAHYSFLPAAMVNSGYAKRNNDLSTGERNLRTGVESLPRTTSRERGSLVSDITLSWNVLDFGLSYVRARQSADRILIADEARRKVMHRILEDVRTAYWRAVSSDRMVTKLQALEGRTRAAQANARTLSTANETSPVTALTYERELIEIRRTLQQLQHELSVSKSQLAALMNLKPGTEFALGASIDTSHPPLLGVDEASLIDAALINRSEIRDIAYQQRINKHEAHAALLELLPGLQLYAGANHDTNKYLLHNEWVTWGAKSSWNLVRLYQYPARRGVVEAQDTLLRTRALAVTMAVMTQVHVSRIRFHNAKRELDTAKEYLDVQSRLVKLMRVEAQAERISEQTLIREELNTLVAEVKRDIAFSVAQNALATVYSSAGYDPYPGDFAQTVSVNDLAAQLKKVPLEAGEQSAHWKVSVVARR